MSPAAGSSPAALNPPPVHGAHTPSSTRSSSRHGLNDHAPGGPSFVSESSSLDARESQVSAPVNMSVVFALSAKVQPVMAWRKLEAPWNIPCAFVTCDIPH